MKETGGGDETRADTPNNNVCSTAHNVEERKRKKNIQSGFFFICVQFSCVWFAETFDPTRKVVTFLQKVHTLKPRIKRKILIVNTDL